MAATKSHPATYDTRVPPSATIPYPTPGTHRPSQVPRPASPNRGVDSAATLEITTHELPINGRSFSVPENPLAAFCYTRPRTMASFRAYLVGTAVEDIALLSVQASTNSVAAPPAASVTVSQGLTTALPALRKNSRP